MLFITSIFLVEPVIGPALSIGIMGQLCQLAVAAVCRTAVGREDRRAWRALVHGVTKSRCEGSFGRAVGSPINGRDGEDKSKGSGFISTLTLTGLPPTKGFRDSCKTWLGFNGVHKLCTNGFVVSGFQGPVVGGTVPSPGSKASSKEIKGNVSSSPLQPSQDDPSPPSVPQGPGNPPVSSVRRYAIVSFFPIPGQRLLSPREASSSTP